MKALRRQNSTFLQLLICRHFKQFTNKQHSFSITMFGCAIRRLHDAILSSPSRMSRQNCTKIFVVCQTWCEFDSNVRAPLRLCPANGCACSVPRFRVISTNATPSRSPLHPMTQRCPCSSRPSGRGPGNSTTKYRPHSRPVSTTRWLVWNIRLPYSVLSSFLSINKNLIHWAEYCSCIWTVRTAPATRTGVTTKWPCWLGVESVWRRMPAFSRIWYTPHTTTNTLRLHAKRWPRFHVTIKHWNFWKYFLSGKNEDKKAVMSCNDVHATSWCLLLFQTVPSWLHATIMLSCKMQL